MKKVIIGDYQFSMKSDWVDLTLSDFVALCRIPMPEKLMNLYKNAEDKEKWNEAFEAITFEDNEKIHPEYYGKVIGLLSDIPESIIELINAEQRTELFNQYLFHLAYSTVTDYPNIIVDGVTELYEPEEIDELNFKGGTYYFPKSKNVNGQNTPMSDEPIVTFTEASSIVTTWKKISESGAEYASLVPALYLRKKGEQYSQETTLERSELFKELPMNIIWSLFFYTLKSEMNSLLDIPLSIMENGTIKKKTLQIKVE